MSTKRGFLTQAAAVAEVGFDLPQVSANFKHFVLKIRPGIFFSDDAAFKSKKRELVA